MKHLKNLKYFKIHSAKNQKRVSIITEAHTLSEEDIKNNLAQFRAQNDIPVTRTYRNYFRGLYLTLKPELVQVTVTQIITHFYKSTIKLIWWLYKNYRTVNERGIEDIKIEISNIDINKTPVCNIVELNNNIKRIWQLCYQYFNLTTDLYEKVKLAHMQ